MSLLNVVDAGHGVDVITGVERAGDEPLSLRVPSSTHVLTADGQPHPLASTASRNRTFLVDQPHYQGMGVGIYQPFGVQPRAIADLQVLALYAVLHYLKVPRVTVQVEGGDLMRAEGWSLFDSQPKVSPLA